MLNNQEITEEIKKEIKICIETNENENTTTPNLWDSVKAVLRGKKKESEVAQLCPTLCDPMDCSLPGSSVHGILQARILEFPFPSPEDLPNPGTEPGSPALQADSLPSEPPAKPF